MLGERPPQLSEGSWEMSKAGEGAIMNAMQVRGLRLRRGGGVAG